MPINQGNKVKAKKQNNASSQLMLDFTAARKELASALDTYTRTAEKVIESAVRQERHEVYAAVGEDRQLFNRLVKHLAVQRFQGDFHKAYIHVYAVLGAIFKYNPAARTDKPHKSHVAQLEKDGMMPDALRTVRALLLV
jgi:hypothetical protein